MDIKSFEKLININRPILITGPSGVGKSTLAQKIFKSSIIYKRSFQTLHIASLKDDLIESELFGHLKGSFTGAVENKSGYFQKSQGGTLFIDEIGELSLEVQKKLLYILEEKEFIAVGDTRVQKFDGRFIFATNKNLKEEVIKGNFREDLYYRLMVFQLHISKISDDKMVLAENILKEFKRSKNEFNKPHLLMSEDTLNFLNNYSWPGNYRELKNTIDYLVVHSDRKVTLNQLPFWLTENIESDENNYSNDYWGTLEKFESRYLKWILEKNQGKINETSKLIGLSKAALIYKAKKYRINTQMIRAVQVPDNTEASAA